jgi:hypothetical protein
MKVKIIIARLLAITMIFSHLSCKKDYLNKTDPTRVNTDLFYKDSSQVEQAINGVYSTLQGIANDQWITNELPSDNTTIDFNPGDRGQSDRIEAFEFYTVNANSTNLNSSYINHYNSINNINTTLAKMQGAEGLSDSIKATNEGQLKFIRAYLYFELTQYYGDVVLILEPIKQPSDAWTYQRESQDKVYAQIEADLKDAVSELPVKYQAGHVGRATKGAALSLLGKVYLTEKKYSDAATTLAQVLPLGYDLNDNYADAFNPDKKNGIESVFEIQYAQNIDGEWSSFIYTFAPRLSYGAVTGFSQSNPGGWNIPTNDIINAYEPGDKRKDASVGLDFKSPITNQTIPYIKKYDHEHAVYGRTDDNWPVLRYSDVLLMLAEAINEQGAPTADAYTYLNKVRHRAGLADVSGLTQQTFRDTLAHERRVELAFENWRWFDLKRTMTPDQLATFLNNYAAKEKANPTVSRQGIPYSSTDYVFSPFEALFPVPANEIIVNPKLTQTPGY